VPRALVCFTGDLQKELGHTLLWRQGTERHVAKRLEEARMMLVAAQPDIVLVDRDLPWADRLIAAIREDPKTRRVSLVVVARGDFDPSEVALLEAGVNAILRLPAGAEWDARLERLLHVPVRREGRFSVHFRVDALSAAGAPVPGLALNLSLHGILLETSVSLAVGDEVRLQFTLAGSEPIDTLGRVVRVAGSDRYGVQFDQVSARGREAIHRFTQDKEAV
jgi:CheY-like chemotaxis protein